MKPMKNRVFKTGALNDAIAYEIVLPFSDLLSALKIKPTHIPIIIRITTHRMNVLIGAN